MKKRDLLGLTVPEVQGQAAVYLMMALLLAESPNGQHAPRQETERECVCASVSPVPNSQPQRCHPGDLI